MQHEGSSGVARPRQKSMYKFSANISVLYRELPLEQRFAAAARDGFKAVECWFPYELGAARVISLLADEGLAFTGLNTLPGSEGMWGIAAIPGHEAAFEASFKDGLEFAEKIGAMTLHVMAGLTGGVPAYEADLAYMRNLDKAVKAAEGSSVRLVIEPLNSRDRPGYFLHDVEHAARVIDHFGVDRLQMMFDCYHVQMEQGSVFARIERNLHRIAHIQIAAIPGRNEPDSGELDYRWLLEAIHKAGYAGWVGAEYIPRADTTEGLSWRENVSRT